jgi:NADH:ubiquinone oxidoreductase subunit
MTIGTRLFTWLRGEYVGSDEQGNRYYHEKKPVKGRKRRRWVMYNGVVEASRVPPDWHGWLHYTVDTPPPAGGLPRKSWQKPHLPNLTGTAAAYRPPGDILNPVPQAKPDSQYEPWRPN